MTTPILISPTDKLRWELKARIDELIWATGANSLSKDDAKIFTDRIGILVKQLTELGRK